MALFGIDDSQSSSSPLFQVAVAGRRDSAAKTDNSESETAPESAPPVAESSRTSIMAGHFVHAGRKESKYITGLKAGLSAQKDFMTRMQSVITGTQDVLSLTEKAMAHQGKTMTVAEKVLLGQKAADDVKTIVDDKVSDTHEEELENIREDVEEKAEEATAPESEKARKDDATPQEALEETLAKTTTETKTEDGALAAAAPAGGNETGTAAPETEGRQAAPAEASDTAPTLPSVDRMV